MDIPPPSVASTPRRQHQTHTGRVADLNLARERAEWIETVDLPTKFSALQIIQDFYEYMTRQFPHFSIKALCSDNGGEFRSAAIENWTKSLDVKRQFSVAYSPQQNGVTERIDRTIREKATCQLLTAHLPEAWWKESVGTILKRRFRRCERMQKRFKRS